MAMTITARRHVRFHRVDPFPSSGQKSKAITGRSIRARIVSCRDIGTYVRVWSSKRKGKVRGGSPSLFLVSEGRFEGWATCPSRTLARPWPRDPPRARARATEIRRVSSPFGNTLRDCESIVRSHPRSGLTWSYCDETSSVPPKEAGGLRRLPFWLWGLGVTPPICG